MEITTNVSGADKVRVNLAGLPAGLKKHVMAGMRTVGAGIERHVKVNKLSGQALSVRTGTLRRAIFLRVGAQGDDIVAVIGADMAKARYARVQELGGVIRPVKSRYLAIPIGEARTASGAARFTARQFITDPKGFGYVGSFTRDKVIFGKKEGGAIEPLFALKSQTTLKPVGYLSGAASDKRQWAIDTLRESVSRAVKEAGGAAS